MRRGVFYFHHVEGDNVHSQLRFPLCHTLDEFPNGSSFLPLVRHTGRQSLRYMYMAHRRRSFASLPALLSAESSISPVQVDPRLTSHRVVTTLHSLDLFSKRQKVFVISGNTNVHFTMDTTKRQHQNGPAKLFYESRWRQYSPFTPGALGLHYYKQSTTFPAEIGRLRFRLCDNSYMFDQERDLYPPSGGPWYYFSHHFGHSSLLRPLANIRYQDGSFKLPDTSLARSQHHCVLKSSCSCSIVLAQPLAQPAQNGIAG